MAWSFHFPVDSGLSWHFLVSGGPFSFLGALSCWCSGEIRNGMTPDPCNHPLPIVSLIRESQNGSFPYSQPMAPASDLLLAVHFVLDLLLACCSGNAGMSETTSMVIFGSFHFSFPGGFLMRGPTGFIPFLFFSISSTPRTRTRRGPAGRATGWPATWEAAPAP